MPRRAISMSRRIRSLPRHHIRAKRGAETDWLLREHRDGVTDPDSARLGPTDAGRGNVGEKDDLLVGDVIGEPGEIRLRIRDE